MPSVWTRSDGGYVDRYSFFTNVQTATDTNSRASYVGRVSFLVKPTDRLTIAPSLYFQRVNKEDSDVWWSTRGVHQSYYNIPQPTHERVVLPSLSVEYAFAPFSVKSITSYYSRRQDGTNEFFHSSKQDLFYAQVPDYYLADDITQTQENVTQEIRFTSSSQGGLTWVGGFYFASNREGYHEAEAEPLANALWLALTGYDIADNFGVPQLPGDLSYLDRRIVKEEESALFADFTLRLVGGLRLTACVRASHTRFSFTDVSDGPFGVAADLRPLSTGGSAGEHPVTPKAGLSYQTGDSLVYATASKGYRIGGANQLLPNICQAQLESLGVHGAAPPYTSDSVWSYEVGAKTRAAQGRVVLSASAFWIDWSRIQGNIPLNSCAYSYTGNFGTAVSRGFDLQAALEPVHGLTLTGNVAMTDARYTRRVVVPGATAALLVRDGDPLLYPPGGRRVSPRPMRRRWRQDLRAMSAPMPPTPATTCAPIPRA